MKHAILMTVYRDANLINRLINLYPSSFDIYIHIDKKCSINVTEIKAGNHNLTVIKKYKINWGGINHLKAFIALLDLASAKQKYDYYHLVTGQDAFVSSEEKLDAFIHKYPINTSFVETYEIPDEKYTTWESGWGIFDYFFFSDLINYNLKTKKGSFLWRITKFIHHILHIKRKRPTYKVYIGSLYCSLSAYAVNTIICSRLYNQLIKRLRYTLCGEGVFFNTLLKNCGCPIENHTLTYTDWNSSKEKPKILDDTDYLKWSEEKFFIRKVDMQKSSKLLSKLGI